MTERKDNRNMANGNTVYLQREFKKPEFFNKMYCSNNTIRKLKKFEI